MGKQKKQSNATLVVQFKPAETRGSGESAQFPQKFLEGYTAPDFGKIVNETQFEAGEVFMVSPDGWRGCDDFGNSPMKHPGLVIRRARRRDVNVHMLPGTTHCRNHNQSFEAEYPSLFYGSTVKKVQNSVFLLDYATPVPRTDVDAFYMVLDQRDTHRLLGLLRTRSQRS